MKTNAIAKTSIVTLISVKTGNLEGFSSRDQARDVARVLRRATTARGKVTVKQDVKDRNGKWAVGLVHNDGRGVMSLNKR